MAATAVGLLLEHNRAILTYIGDSRIYLVRNGHIVAVTVDHNLSTQLIRMGRPPVFARNVPRAKALVRCVGDFDWSESGELIPMPLACEFFELTLLPGDKLVLCSDGIVDYAATDEEGAELLIREIVEQASGSRWAAFDLMVAANRGGGGDNIACIVLGFEEPDEYEDYR